MTDRPARPVSTVFLGSGRFAQPALERLAAHPSVAVRAVVTAPPRPAGRSHQPTPTPVHDQALALGLDVRTPGRLRDPDTIADLLSLAPDLVVLADYGQIVPRALLDRPFGALNLHPSLLPRHRGATPIPATILAGDDETGVSLIVMDAGIDTGPVVAAERTRVLPGEDAPALERRLAVLAGDLLARSLDPWLDGALTAVDQAVDGATLTRTLTRGDGRLDPRKPAAELERMVRAYRPWPGTFLELDGLRLAVLAAHVAPSAPSDVPGALVAGSSGPALATVEGRLVLEQVQPAGGRAMSGEALLRGRPGLIGAAVGLDGASARTPAGNPSPDRG